MGNENVDPAQVAIFEASGINGARDLRDTVNDFLKMKSLVGGRLVDVQYKFCWHEGVPFYSAIIIFY